jgi:hypothetical protein
MDFAPITPFTIVDNFIFIEDGILKLGLNFAGIL